MAKKKIIRRRRGPIWVTRDKRQLKPKAMSTSHLIATIRMRMRAARSHMLSDALDALAYASSAPDGASMAAEQASNDLMARHDDPPSQLAYARRHRPIVEALYKELGRRKLTIDSVLL